MNVGPSPERVTRVRESGPIGVTPVPPSQDHVITGEYWSDTTTRSVTSLTRARTCILVTGRKWEHVRYRQPSVHARSPAKIVGLDFAIRQIVSNSDFCVRPKKFPFAADMKI